MLLWLFPGSILQCKLHCASNQIFYMADDLLRFFLHSVFNPFQNKTNKPEFEKVCYERAIFLSNVQAFCLTKLVCDIQHQLIYQAVKIIVQAFARCMAIDIHDERLILLHRPEDGQVSLLPGFVGTVILQHRITIRYADPFYQINDILKMIIEGLPVDLGFLGYVVMVILSSGFSDSKSFKANAMAFLVVDLLIVRTSSIGRVV